jgi:hypothetical protein
MATMEAQDRQVAYKATRDGNPITNVEYLYRALDYIGRLWMTTKDDLYRMICEVEHDFMVAGNMGQDKVMEIIKGNFFWPGVGKYIEDFVRSCESCQPSKAPR